MGKITKEVEIVGLKSNKKLEALFDSGSGGSFIRQIFSDGVHIEDLGFTKYRSFRKIRTGDNSRIKAEIIAFPKILIDSVTIEKLEMGVIKSMPVDVILGADIMQRVGINLNFKKEQIEWEKS